MPNFLLSLPQTNPAIKSITKFTVQVEASNKSGAIAFAKWLYRMTAGKELKDKDIMVMAFKKKSQIIANIPE